MATSSLEQIKIYHAIADELLAMSGSGLSKKQLKTYFVLERKLGKPDANKNAISFIQEGVSFMVRDWGVEEEAKALRLRTERSKHYQRLIFVDLALNDVHAHSNFFSKLTESAKVEAERLQSSTRI
jgi:hypothetical protein